jgi:hypothetical protein
VSGVTHEQARCPWCNVPVATAGVVATQLVSPWLCRTLHVKPKRVEPAPRKLLALCPLCGTHPATVPDVIDGRRMLVCVDCRDGVVAEPVNVQPRERVLRALSRSDGMDIGELAQVLGEDDESGRARISALLARACRDGLVKYSGGRMDRVYSIVR